MELIERYLQEIGQHLPRPQRADILSELRSSLMDTLEARFGDTPSEDAVVQVIKEMGSPQKVAASYHADGQYLIGPAWYPTFKLVLGIVFTAVIGAQLLAILIAVSLGQETVVYFDEFLGIFNSLPAALGMVVLVFALLQRLEVAPETPQKEFDPRKLPPLEGDEPIKRGEQVFGIMFGVIVFAVLAQFTLRGGFAGTGPFANPVIDQNFLWIASSMAAGIVVDIWLLWKGRWQTASRVVKIGSEIFSMVVLWVLIQGHHTWLAEAGVLGFMDSLNQLTKLTPQTAQIVGMVVFRIALSVAFIISGVEMLIQVYRLVKAGLKVNETKQMGVVGMMGGK